MKTFRFLFILIIYSSCIICQKNTPEAIEQIIDEIAENYEEETDFSLITENLLFLYENPININSCTYEDLALLHFLTDFQISSLIDYVKKRGAIVSLSEIQYIYGFDVQTTKLLIPFIAIDSPESVNKTGNKKNHNFRHDLFLTAKRNFEVSKGYAPINDSLLLADPEVNYYPGNPLKTRWRYTLTGNRLLVGVQAENDAGEDFFCRSNNGFDFYSGYIQLKNNGVLENITLGDYHLQFGQGLTLWNGFSTGKSFSSLSRYSEGIRKFSSADENNFFRGVATTMNLPIFKVTAFFSYKNIDANITDTVNGTHSFSSFLISGSHRTNSEIDDEKSVKLVSLGSNVSFKREYFKAGFTLVRYDFGAEYNPEEKPYNAYCFEGDGVTNMGADYRLRIRKTHFFGEISTGNKHWAILNGLEANLHPLISFSALYRNYSKGFYAYMNSPFSEYSSKNNEEGLYIGTSILPYKNFKLSAYIDVFRSPWLRYSINSPSHGNEFFIQLDFVPKKKFYAYLRYKQEYKSRNSSDDKDVISYPVEYSIHKTRANFEYDLTSKISFKTRFEFALCKEENLENESGLLFLQNLVFKPQKIPFSFWLGFSRFNSSSWDTRIYSYENSVPYSFSIPALNDNGIRGYLLLKYTVKEKISFWIKYGYSHYYNRETIGTGLDESEGSTKSEMEVMARIRI